MRNLLPSRDGLLLNDRYGWPSSRDRVCVPMHNLPTPVLAGHDHRCPQTDGTDSTLSADLGLGSLNPYKVCKLRGYIPRDSLTVKHLSVS